jgi:hypothetical protein
MTGLSASTKIIYENHKDLSRYVLSCCLLFCSKVAAPHPMSRFGRRGLRSLADVCEPAFGRGDMQYARDEHHRCDSRLSGDGDHVGVESCFHRMPQ